MLSNEFMSFTEEILGFRRDMNGEEKGIGQKTH
jgi:hypothetical protein